MKPICVPCQRFYRPIKTGFAFIEGMPAHDGGVAEAVPGSAYPDHWKPYKLYEGDKWKCEGCGEEIIVGVARSPISEHYKPDFKRLCEQLGADFQVNDC